MIVAGADAELIQNNLLECEELLNECSEELFKQSDIVPGNSEDTKRLAREQRAVIDDLQNQVKDALRSLSPEMFGDGSKDGS